MRWPWTVPVNGAGRWPLLLLAWLGSGAALAGPGVDIAAPEQALSFARYAGPQGPRVIAVTAYQDGRVQGVELAGPEPRDDALGVYRALGRDGILARIAAAEHRVTIPLERLLPPLELRDRHIAVGTNYPAHADESQVEDGPFLFPKHVAPTPSRSAVSVADRLLDYEVELCFVSLEDVPAGQLPREWGLILCNDFTDRARLLRHINPAAVTSGDGFTTGKSFPGALPVGDLFVVPHEVRHFAAELRLRLWRDKALRQDTLVSRAVWDIDEILRQAWNRAEQRWVHGDEAVGLFAADGRLPARSLVLSGTPDGTLFAGISVSQKLRGLGRWLLGGWDRPLASWVIETYIADAQREGLFLRAGDTVSIRVDRMGSIETRILP